MRNLHALILVCLLLGSLCGYASAISLLRDTPPVPLRPDETPGIGESVQEAVPRPLSPANLTVRRTSPARAVSGDTVEVLLTVTNEGSQGVTVTLSEDQRPGADYPDARPVLYRRYQGLSIPFYEWRFDLAGRSAATVSYRIRPRSPGTIAFTPAIAADQYGNAFPSESGYIVVGCRPDGRCGPGENSIYCPEDCPGGSADGTCDGIADGRRDPDCRPGADPDRGAAREIPPEQTPESGPDPVHLLVALAIAGAAGIWFRLEGKRR